MYYNKLVLFLALFTFTAVQGDEPLKLQQVDAQLDSQYSYNIDFLTDKINVLKLQQTELKLEHEKKLLKLRQEKEKLLLENELYFARENKRLAKRTAAKKQLNLDNDISHEKHRQTKINLEQELDNLSIENDIFEERNKQKQLVIEAQLNELKFKKLKLERQIAERKRQQEWDSQVNIPPQYLQEPFKDGKLTISDRKISLEGPIVPGTADYIIGRIHYYNNKNNEYPIFLIIGYCRGGSVMEGVRILKAMKHSIAPVYVVVKSFAASMAAIITTLADRSYAYPDTILLHHQVWGQSRGNKTQQMERLKILDEWSNRVLTPVANKMGITLTEFIEAMYKHSTNGDWLEFADSAIKYKWVDNIVEDIRDSSYIRKPKAKIRNQGQMTLASDNLAQQGKTYVSLPQLRAFDVYHLYNPDNYYQY